MRQPVDLLPLRRRIRPGDARVLVQAPYFHVEAELHACDIGKAGNRRGTGRQGRARQRNVAFAGKQSRGRIEPHPARTGNINLGPGMQVGEIPLGSARSVQRLDVGGELDQVSGCEARRESEVTESLHQQPRGIAARALPCAQGFLAGLNPGFHTHDVTDVALQARVGGNEHVDDRQVVTQFAPKPRKPFGKQRPGNFLFQEWRQLDLELAGIGERIFLGVLFDEEVERIDDGHVGHQIDGHLELARLFGKHQARNPVAERVLLPVEEMRRRFDLQRVAVDRRAAVWRGPQPDLVRRQRHRLVEVVRRLVRQPYSDCHACNPTTDKGTLTCTRKGCEA